MRVRWVGKPACSTISAATSYSARPVIPGRAASRAASSAERATSRRAATGGHLAVDEGARHVRPAAAGVVARPQVDGDREAGRERAGAGIVAAAGAQRHDHDVRRRGGSGRRAGGAHGRPHGLGRERLARVHEVVARVARAADERLGGGHPGLGGALGAPDPVELGRRLDAPAVLHGGAVDVQPQPFGAQPVGDGDREVTRHDRLLDAPLPQCPDRDLDLRLLPRHALLEQLEPPEAVAQLHQRARQRRLDPRQLEAVGEHERLVAARDVEERVHDLERDLVPQRRRPDRVAVEQERRHLELDLPVDAGDRARRRPRPCRRRRG